jgi:type IV secretion system protein VirB9
MKRVVTALGVLVALCTAQAGSAMALQNDARLETVAYHEGAVVPVSSAVGHGVMIMFEPGERVVEFGVVDAEAFNIEESVNTGSLIIRTLRAPTDPMITVRTQLRSYRFSVRTGMPEDAQMVVRFNYDAELYSNASGASKNDSALPARAPIPSAALPRYRITGTPSLRPTAISDDGTRTYLTWGEDQALPAVFAINALGDEEIVDGYMRAGIYTIDRVYPRLVFRIDRKAAKAERIVREGGK